MNQGMARPDQVRVRSLLAEAITILCKNCLQYQSEFCVEGLLGITLDNNDVFLVNIKENVRDKGAGMSVSQFMGGLLPSAMGMPQRSNTPLTGREAMIARARSLTQRAMGRGRSALSLRGKRGRGFMPNVRSHPPIKRQHLDDDTHDLTASHSQVPNSSAHAAGDDGSAPIKQEPGADGSVPTMDFGDMLKQFEDGATGQSGGKKDGDHVPQIEVIEEDDEETKNVIESSVDVKPSLAGSSVEHNELLFGNSAAGYSGGNQVPYPPSGPGAPHDMFQSMGMNMDMQGMPGMGAPGMVGAGGLAMYGPGSSPGFGRGRGRSRGRGLGRGRGSGSAPLPSNPSASNSANPDANSSDMSPQMISSQRFRCQACHKDFSSRSNCAQHLREVHLKRDAKMCAICHKKFCRVSNLRVHIKKHGLAQPDQYIVPVLPARM